jgi:hypothetical protein
VDEPRLDRRAITQGHVDAEILGGEVGGRERGRLLVSERRGDE